MKIFFEEYQYKREDLEKYLSSHYYSVSKDRKKAFTNYVGYFYYYNQEFEQSDSVFILPKVFVNENNLAFGEFSPEELIDLENDENPVHNREGLKQLIYELSVWLFRAINIYKDDNRYTRIIEDAKMPDVVSNKGEEKETFLEIILQLLRFNKDNHHIFTSISIMNNSGNNKIHWGKTVSKTQPIIQNKRPVYVNFINKKRIIDEDEQLIILFYSVLEYIKQTFHFRVSMNMQYRLMTITEIKEMIKNAKGTRMLKRIRYKYFTDKLVKLWNLMYVFFDRAERIATGRYHEETLLAKNFERIFEDMVDYLISDDKYPEELRYQDDGKAVDHIFSDNSLIYNTEKIFYVGDSKYYKPHNGLGKYSIMKQYTYAKNIIQRNIEEVTLSENRKGLEKGYYQYRDDLTEGYNITPNFFVFGLVQRNKNTGKYNFVDDLLNKSDDGHENEKNEFWQYKLQFKNRLFDRDTLILQKYNINFLFVLTVYATQQVSIKNSFRVKIRNKIQKDLIEALKRHYDFYQVCLTDNKHEETQIGTDTAVIEKFVNINFKQLIGRVFSFEITPNKRKLIFANEKSISEKSQQIPNIESQHNLVEYYF